MHSLALSNRNGRRYTDCGNTSAVRPMQNGFQYLFQIVSAFQPCPEFQLFFPDFHAQGFICRYKRLYFLRRVPRIAGNRWNDIRSAASFRFPGDFLTRLYTNRRGTSISSSAVRCRVGQSDQRYFLSAATCLNQVIQFPPLIPVAYFPPPDLTIVR